MSAPQQQTAAEQQAFYAELNDSMELLIHAVAIRYSLNSADVTLAAIETLANGMGCASPTGIPKHLAALAWIMRLKSEGEDVPMRAQTEMTRAYSQIRGDLALIRSAAQGTA